LIVPLAVGLAAYGAAQAYFVASSIREQARSQAATDSLRLANTVARSLRHDMLNTRREHIYNIVETIGDQKGIEFVRVMNNEGKIVFSTVASEKGKVVSRREESCSQCHGRGKRTTKLGADDHARVYQSKSGEWTLAAIDVMYNEPSCWNAECHVHTKEQHFLGALDVGLSLEETNERVSTAIRGEVFYTGLSTAFVCTLVALFVWFFINRPVKKLVNATHVVASGDLDISIPVKSDDEIGQLARSFNTMAADLKKAQLELSTWAETLEKQVEEKTRDLEAAQVQVLRAEKLSSLGLLAAGVAHELNSPLTGIIALTHLLLRKTSEGSQEQDDLKVIAYEADRCASIIRQLLDFSHQSPPRITEGEVNAVIERALSLVERQAAFLDIEIVRDLCPDLPTVMLDADQFLQVILNLLVNAAEAMGGDGVLTIRTRPLGSVSDSGRPKSVEIQVSDTGVGISKEIMGKIFDPFFTTKDVGKGTGLGLAVTYGVIKRHKGKIAVSSEEGKGATFTITIPVAQAAQEANGLAPGH
jgi:two-component system NtrC family sensor kinase